MFFWLQISGGKWKLRFACIYAGTSRSLLVADSRQKVKTQVCLHLLGVVQTDRGPLGVVQTDRGPLGVVACSCGRGRRHHHLGYTGAESFGGHAAPSEIARRRERPIFGRTAAPPSRVHWCRILRTDLLVMMMAMMIPMMALLMKLGQDSTHRQLLGYKYGSRRRVQARFDSQRRHHAGRITLLAD